MFDGFSTIDVHNRYRQGTLELEREWHTQRWQLRLFATVLGMILTNSYFAYRHDCRHHLIEEIDDFNQFIGKAAIQLIRNRLLMTQRRKRQRENGHGSDQVSSFCN